jgi:hypothetical protein
VNWEALTAVATAASALVILATAIVGVWQLQHLRRATQLDGMLRLVDELTSPKVLGAIAYVRNEAPRRMQDPGYIDALLARPVQEETPEFTILRWLEKLGVLAKNGLIDPTTLFEMNQPDYLHLWVVLKPVLDPIRARSAISPFNNAEYLCARSEQWARRAWGSATVDELLARYRAGLPSDLRAAESR